MLIKNKPKTKEKIIKFIAATKKGKSKINSVSKIRKIKAIIKNREEKTILQVL